MVVDRDPRPPLREGYAHTHRGDEEAGGLKMVGVPHCIAWWVGTSRHEGADLKGTDELVRFLNDAVKPKLCYAYERYASAYLRMPT